MSNGLRRCATGYYSTDACPNLIRKEYGMRAYKVQSNWSKEGPARRTTIVVANTLAEVQAVLTEKYPETTHIFKAELVDEEVII